MLLDTDTVSALMALDPVALNRAAEYVREYPRYTISVVTYFEVVRGLRAVRSIRREREFQVFVANTTVLPVTEKIFEAAANVYATLHRQGRLIPDADLLIGATALIHGLAIATNNEDDFRRIPGLTVVNWLRPPS